MGPVWGAARGTWKLGCCLGSRSGPGSGAKWGRPRGPFWGPPPRDWGTAWGPAGVHLGPVLGSALGCFSREKRHFPSASKQGAFPLEAWATREGKARAKTSISKPNHGKCPLWPENRPNPRFLCQMTENAHFCMKIDQIRDFCAK